MNTLIMPDLFHFPVTVLPSLPSPQFPTLALGYVLSINACIGSTNTIAFYDSTFGITRPHHGRILETSFDREAVVNDPTCNCTLPSSVGLIKCLKVQIYATTYPLSRPEILNNWPSIDTSLPNTILAACRRTNELCCMDSRQPD
jgi:hypothetical protein